MFMLWMGAQYRSLNRKRIMRYSAAIRINRKISPLASISVLYDVMNDILVDVSLHSYRYNERESSLFTYPSSGNKESLTLRSIHFLLENGNIEYLVTNLMPEQMTVANFPDLHRL